MNSNDRLRGWVGLLLLSVGPLHWGAALFAADSTVSQARSQDIAVIIWGGIPGSGGQPSPFELVENHRRASTLPADGMVFNLTHAGGYFVDDGFSTTPRRFVYSEIKPDIDTWRSLQLGNLEQNFVRVNIGMVPDCLGNDTAWKTVLDNVALAARCARECGATGLMLDSEMYQCYNTGVAPFRYAGHPELTFEEYKLHVRRRGRQFMEAVNSQMPDAKLMITFATSSACRPAENPQALLTYNVMALMPAFVDGLMDQATARNEIIDVFEGAYGFQSRAEFARARTLIKQTAAELSADPVRYRQMIRVGFGLFIHGGGGENSLQADFTKNTQTPEQLYNTLRFAAEFSDGYVWLYSLPWLKLPPAYLQAIEEFRRQKASLSARWVFQAKRMEISNSSSASVSGAGQQNWFFSGDYVSLSTVPQGGPLNSKGSVAFWPRSDRKLPTGVYEVLVDLIHANVKKHNAGSPPGDRNGSFSYRVSLRPGSAGRLSFQRGSREGFISYHPVDADNCNAGGVGPVALTNFIAYGHHAPGGSTGPIELSDAKLSDIRFEFRDDEFLNYGTVGVRSITLVPLKFQRPGEPE